MSVNDTIAQVADVPMPGTEGHLLRVRIVGNRAGPQVDVRVFTPFTAAKTPFPTARGVALPVGLLPGLSEALAAAEKEARERGLIGGDA